MVVMIRILTLAIILFFAPPAQAVDNMLVELVRVVDGDTIVVNIADWPDIVGKNIGVRVAGCDTRELRDKRPEIRAMAYEAKDVVTALLRNAHTIELRNIERGKYFRIVADVYADGTNVSQVLIMYGLAMPYDGGKKPW